MYKLSGSYHLKVTIDSTTSEFYYEMKTLIATPEVQGSSCQNLCGPQW